MDQSSGSDPEELMELTAWREGFPATKRTMQVPRRMAVEIARWYAQSGWLVKIEPVPLE